MAYRAVSDLVSASSQSSLPATLPFGPLTSSPFLKHTKFSVASGPLHLFPLPGISYLRSSHGFLFLLIPVLAEMSPLQREALQDHLG